VRIRKQKDEGGKAGVKYSAAAEKLDREVPTSACII